MRRQEDGPPRWLLLLALLLLGTALGIELFRRIGAPPAPPELPPIQAQAEPPRAWPSPALSPVGDRLALVRSTLSGDELLSFLMSKAGSPAAREFAAAFMAKPELREAWAVFQRDKDALKFIKTVRDDETFKDLLVEAQRKAPFRKLVDEATAQPGIGALLREEREGDRAAAPSPPDAAPPMPETASASAASPRGVGSAGGAFSVTRLARLLASEPGAGAPTVFERRLLSELPPELLAKLRSELSGGKTLRQSCPGLGLGEDCEKLAASIGAHAQAAAAGPIDSGQGVHPTAGTTPTPTPTPSPTPSPTPTETLSSDCLYALVPRAGQGLGYPVSRSHCLDSCQRSWSWALENWAGKFEMTYTCKFMGVVIGGGTSPKAAPAPSPAPTPRPRP